MCPFCEIGETVSEAALDHSVFSTLLSTTLREQNLLPAAARAKFHPTLLICLETFTGTVKARESVLPLSTSQAHMLYGRLLACLLNCSGSDVFAGVSPVQTRARTSPAAAALSAHRTGWFHARAGLNVISA